GTEDAFLLRQRLERGERFIIGAADILGAAALLQMRVLRADCRIIETGRDRPGFVDLPFVILQHVRLRAVEDSGPSAKQSRAMLVAVDSLARRLDANQSHWIVDEVGKQADRIGTAADAGHDRVGQSPELLKDLCARLAPY